jgi:hypothetical protein
MRRRKHRNPTSTFKAMVALRSRLIPNRLIHRTKIRKLGRRVGTITTELLDHGIVR